MVAARTVRLKVAYKTPGALLSEYTRSVGAGLVAIQSKKSLPLGTRFIFEMWAEGARTPVEVEGEVIQITSPIKGRHLLHVRYEPGKDRAGLDELIHRVFDAQKESPNRRHPRVPILLRASEETAYSSGYVIRDLSRAGAGLEIEAPGVPEGLQLGTPFLIELSFATGAVPLHGEVVWVFQPPEERKKWINPAFGVSFGKLRSDVQERLEKLLKLAIIPPPPWRARVSYGPNAVSRMP